jgi:Tfp pilus assembly protein PilO
MKYPVLAGIRWRELCFLGGAALVLALTGLYTASEWLTVRRLSAELVQAKAYLAQQDQLAQQQADLEQRLDQARKKTRHTLGALPTEEKQPALLAALNRAAAENGVGVTKLTVHSPTPAGGAAQEVQIEAIVHGGYANLKGYLAEITAGERYLALKSLEFVRPEGTGAGVLEARFVLAAYFLPDPDLPEPSGAPAPAQSFSPPLGKSDPFS